MLRRPKIREFREIREDVLTMREGIITNVDEVTEGTRTVTAEDRAEQEDRLLAWYGRVLSMLAKGDPPLPEPDDYPLWFFDKANLPDLMAHWMGRPTGPGG